MWEPAESAIQEVREALGLSQRDLAREAGVSHSSISRYERGHAITRRTLRRLTATLGQLVAAHIQKAALRDH